MRIEKTSVLRSMIGLAGVIALMAWSAPPEPSLDALHQSFVDPPSNARIMMRWWWFGAAVTKPELARELQTMKAGGIGGVEIQPVYPLALDDPQTGFKNLPYLSPEFLDAVRFTSDKARELGLRVDMTLCSGWPYGGPHVPVSQAAGALRFESVEITPGVNSV
ncbi:MAG TPA: glycosyl hydrolase, partial [Bryobacteraceae bacterium]|nr:glycosyl hydrolase [Bryobacteraceae bacterium]